MKVMYARQCGWAHKSNAPLRTLRSLFVAAVVLAGCHPAWSPPAPQPNTPDSKPAAIPKQEAPNDTDGDRVVVTDRAAKQVRKLLAQTPGAKYLRVSVSDNTLKLDLEPRTDPKKDLANESQGISVVMARSSAATLPIGIVVDYIDEGTRGFRITSPGSDRDQTDDGVSLADARRGFKTTLRPQKDRDKTPVPAPPGDIFRLVRYEAPPGKLAAYLTPDPMDGKKRPAIIWITGGDCNSIGEGCWQDGGLLGAQSASAYRKAGIVMMFPALRGGNDNPGDKEGFLGEVDDVMAAAAFIREQPYVDPDRVYLGGHSTGGTMALLTAECSGSFRAVFCFGPADDVLGYGLGDLPFSLTDPKELRLRSPAQWLHSIRSPVFVFEGADGGNATGLRLMSRKANNPNAQFFLVQEANHFSILGPTNQRIAEKILKDTGPTCNLKFAEEEVNAPFLK